MNKFLILACCCVNLSVQAQTKKVSFVASKTEKKVDVMIGGKFFTSYTFPPNFEFYHRKIQLRKRKKLLSELKFKNYVTLILTQKKLQ